MSSKKIKVLIVDDSALMRKLLTSMLRRSAALEVVGAAPNPLVARDMIKALQPDVITLDVEMPKMDGISFLEKIMTLRPTPVVMVSSLTQKGADVTMQALEMGAVDFVAKPAIDIESNMVYLADELIAKVKLAAVTRVKAVRPRAAQTNTVAKVSFDTTETIVAIGASTGGVEVLGRIIAEMPPNAPATLVTQHMPPKFTKNFADRLNSFCSVNVQEAQDGRRVVPGKVFIAPGGRHLTLVRSGADYVCKLSDGPPVCGHKPSVDVMFESVANACGASAIGVILTGMGKDGAHGLLSMREAGASTFGQDEATSLVYGMPKAAWEMDAVERQLPDSKILSAIMRVASERCNVLRI
jgi:two-component system chemotaxis response regulator CheB